MPRTASIAIRTWSRSRSSSVPGARPALRPARLIRETMVCTSTSSTRTRLSSCSYIARSSSSVGCGSCSLIGRSIGRARLAHGIGVDIAQARAAVEGAALALGAVELGQRDVEALLAADGLGPGQQALEGGPRVLLLAALEVDEPAVHPEADGPPDVLLDEPAGMVRGRAALVEVARRLQR